MVCGDVVSGLFKMLQALPGPSNVTTFDSRAGLDSVRYTALKTQEESSSTLKPIHDEQHWVLLAISDNAARAQLFDSKPGNSIRKNICCHGLMSSAGHAYQFFPCRQQWSIARL